MSSWKKARTSATSRSGTSRAAKCPPRSDSVRRAMLALVEGGYPALTMDKAAARAAVGKATVYRRWASRAELAAEALAHAGLTDDVVPVTIGSGRVREELLATLLSVSGGRESSRAGLIAALHDTARQEPELCSLIRVRYVDSLHQALSAVLRRAVERGDLAARQTHQPDG